MTLRQAGHEVILHRDVLPEKTPDPVVAAAALANSAILVAIDKDMKQIAQKYGMTAANGRFDKLHLIRICCSEVQAANRVDQLMSLIEHEWDFTNKKSARRMWVEVGPHFVRSLR